MIEIAFLIRSLDCDGAERQLVTLAKGLDKQRFDVTVLYFYSGGYLPLDKDLKDSGISIICLQKRGRWDLFGFFWRLVRYLKQINPEVLHGYLGDPNLLTIFLKPFFPSTLTIWGIRDSIDRRVSNDWLSRRLFTLECLLSRFANLIIANSHAGRAYHLEHGFPADKMVVIPNGIDTERFKPDPEAGARLRVEWGILENTILIGRVGRLHPMKDHSTFLKAATLLCEDRQDVRFVCVGSGPESYTRELYQLADELGISEKVIWAGARADMSAVYNALDIAASSSCYGEGFPNVIGEAMACGVPCVVTDVGDSAWIVGDTGVVVPPKNPEALKTAIKSLIGDISTNTYNHEQIRQRIIDQFSVPQLVLKTEAALLCLSNDSSSK